MKHKIESKTPTLQVPYNFAGETEILGGLVIICAHMCVYIYIYIFQAVNHFQALIMVPYLMLRKKEVNILVQTHQQIIRTKLNPGFSKKFYKKKFNIGIPRMRALTNFSRVQSPHFGSWGGVWKS